MKPELNALFANGADINRQNIMRILQDNCDTEFGRQYKFAEIRDVDTYRKKVPLSSYQDYADAIERMRSGEQNVLTVYPIYSYCRTSGSMGKSKFIPITVTALEQYADYVVPKVCGKRLYINAFRTNLNEPMAQTALFSEIHHRYLYEHGRMDMNAHIGKELLLFVQDEEDILYAKARAALACADIRLIESVFLYELLTFFAYLEDNWQTILADMQRKIVPSDVKLSPEIKRFLNAMPCPVERVKEIQRECDKGFADIARRLWHNLEYVSGISNRAHITEQNVLQYYLGDVPRNYFGYGASESCIAVSRAWNDFGSILLPPCAFFEFLPYHGNDDTTVLPHECKVGELYETVLTNFSGLYRYRMGDILKVTDFVGESPVLEFMFRRGQMLNIAGEKYDESQLEKAVFSLQEHRLMVTNFCAAVCMDSIPGRYVFVLDAQNPDAASPETAALLLDKALCRCNSEYEDLRQLKRIARPHIYLCRHESFTEFMQAIGLMKQHGHDKPHHLLQREVQEKLWIQILQKIKSSMI